MMEKSSKQYQAFRSHRNNARHRGIPFLFTFEQWLEWWMKDSRWEKRGRRGGDLVMARNGDVGPYSPDNVYCTTSAGNMADVPFEVRSAAMQRAHAAGLLGHHLRIRGEDHPKARCVVTPAGRFGSAALAAEHYGVSRQHAARMARAGVNGWCYALSETKRPDLV
jgi:hypothetical protein